MRVYPCMGGCNWASRDVECETVEVEIGTDSQVDTWKLIKPISYYPGKEGDIHGIFIKKNPLNQFNGDVEVEDITKRLFNLAMSWLDRDSVNPINVDSSFRLTDVEVQDVCQGIRIRDTITDTMVSLLLNYAVKVCDYHLQLIEPKRTSGSENALHLQWVVRDGNAHYEGALSTGVDLDIQDGNRRLAFIRLMRSPGPFDGGDGYVFERYMNVVISLLFQPEDVYYMPAPNAWYNTSTQVSSSHFPLIIIAGDCLFNEETQKAMASAAKRILNSLTELEKGTGARIEHKIVYGLHWDHLKLRIVAHFMNRPGSESWNFCQVVIAQHLISLNPDWNVLYDHTIDDTFIDRWRITCALFAVRREIEHLKSTVQGQPGYSSGLQSRTSNELQLPNEDAPTPQNLSDSYLTGLRQYWRDCESFRIPEEWMPDAEITIPVGEDLQDKVDITRRLIPQLVKVLLKPIEQHLSPLTATEVRLNSKDTKYFGPDFIHSIHVPRAAFDWEVLGVDPETTTESHLTKLYDLLSLSAAKNRDINIYIANMFANLSGYTVDCCPARFQEPNIPHLSVDFALLLKSDVASPIPIPLFFGLYLETRAGSWYESKDRTSRDLGTILGKYLQRINSGLQSGESPGFLFCTVIAGQYVHIFAAGLVDQNTHLHHVDSIPISLTMSNTNSAVELLHRMRLAMALYTLKRHVFLLATRLGDVEGDWRSELL